MTWQAGLCGPGPGCRGRAGCRGGAEAGSGTVLALGLGMVLILACAALAMLGQALAASSRAGAAADLAALAAADTERGLRPGAACATARETAELNGAVLTACAVEKPGSTVRVTVELETGAPWGPAVGRARAGPPPRVGPG
ncbi:Rv3654c family TadE-like protein [Sinomonas sp. RB5]